ncbi:DNA replication licensing factor [Babesia ovata]|uniref:DNA replication licensing factor MCM6 n=1 Tax=Babesia ovata TaxID=189622 RepID=A0A2H6KD98_9APIC|nr:DNA replication licensing factor [Babesia ovata]GBE60961.1 DNA replication licensing factor [Babesia ovata]
MPEEDSMSADSAADNSLTKRRQQTHSQGMTAGDVDVSQEEEAANVQDANISTVFDFFLRSYVAEGEQAYDEDLEEFDDSLSDDEDTAGTYCLNGDPNKPLFYMKRIFTLVSRMSHFSEVLVVHLDHVLNWRPPQSEAGLNLNMQLYKYLVKHFLRVQDALEDKLQGIVDSIAQSLNRESKKLFLQFLHSPSVIHPLKEVRCHMIGELIAIRGQVTRTSDVRPELIRGTFKCKACGTIIENVRQNFKYTVPVKCTSNNCLNLRDWELVMEQSLFCDWQKVRIQEMAQESDTSTMPRSIDVILRHRSVDRLNAGDRVIISGTIIVLPDVPTLLKPGEMPRKVNKQSMRRFESYMISQGLTGIKGVGIKDLNHKLSFLATQVRRVNDFKSTAGDVIDTSSEIQVRADDILNLSNFDWIRRLARGHNTIERLASCIAPKIWGHSEIKKGILLMMVGGVHKSSSNTKLRGDINMCLVGDPSTAKSQFLKFVESFAPRAIYTSGKGSTAAGLTAAVHRDPDSGEFVLEAGALMYADLGICCIDEFDKMNDRDRVSIHEAMEQQTISIAKAGIQATLNARASVLAVCNPRYGRYDTSKSFASNVNLPPPLLSRFDLLYTMQDEADEMVDAKIAWHITGLHGPGVYKSSDLIEDSAEIEHQESPFDQEFNPPLTLDELKLYIELAKRIKPLMQDAAKHKLAQYYVGLRNGDAQSTKRSLRMTVRQLESLIRLSEAIARLKFSDFVEESHVEEAYNIFKSSLLRLSNKDLVVLEEERAPTNDVDDGDEEWIMSTRRRHSADTDADAPPPAPEADLMKIGMSEYEAISAVLLDHVSEHQLLENEIASNELVEWYIQNVVVPRTPEDADAWNLRLQRVVHRLLYVDKKLLARRVQTDIPNVFRLRVHPNYYSSAHVWRRDTMAEEPDVIEVDEDNGSAANASDVDVN